MSNMNQQNGNNKDSLVEKMRALVEKMDLLHAISHKISEQKPLPRVLHEIIESSKEAIHAEACSLLLYDPKDNRLHFIVVSGDQADFFRGGSIEMGLGISGWVAQHKTPLLIENCYNDARFNPEYDRKSEFETRTMMCVPLIRKDTLIGVIQVINKVGGGLFDTDDLAIFKTLAAQCAIAIENARLIEEQIETKALERELETAREIQLQLLPRTLPECEDMEIAAQLISAKQVGGDYYNFFQLSDRYSLFLIADVTGKSISAALVVSTLHSCLRTYLTLKRDDYDLITLVSSINEILLHSLSSNKFVSAWFGLIDHEQRRLTYVNAGHNPPYFFRKGDECPIELFSGGLLLGCFARPYEKQEVAYSSGDVLVFFTDGVTEAWDEKREMFGESRLVASIIQRQSRTAKDILGGIEQDVRRHVADAPQNDDFTCVVMKIK